MTSEDTEGEGFGEKDADAFHKTSFMDVDKKER